MTDERMIRVISCAKCPEFVTDTSVGGYCRILKREPDVFYIGFNECGSATILLNENKIDPDCPLEFAPPPETTIKILYDECREVCRTVHSHTDNWLVSAVQVRLLRKLYPHLLEDEKKCMH